MQTHLSVVAVKHADHRFLIVLKTQGRLGYRKQDFCCCSHISSIYWRSRPLAGKHPRFSGVHSRVLAYRPLCFLYGNRILKGRGTQLCNSTELKRGRTAVRLQQAYPVVYPIRMHKPHGTFDRSAVIKRLLFPRGIISLTKR